MTNPQVPTISVCIPCYKGAPHIAAAIDSVLAQTYTDFELIVIDDNSPDNTAEIVGQYKDPRITYLRNATNLGPAGNWNRCLDVARGKYFKLLPQDDLISPDCLAKQIAVLEGDAQERIALVFCARTILDARDRVIMQRGYPNGSTGLISAKTLIRTSIRRGTNVIGEPGSVLFRKKLVASTGLFDDSIGYVLDVDYWFRLLLNGDAYYIADPLASFRVSGGSWSVRIGNRQSLEFRMFIQKIKAKPEFGVGGGDAIAGYVMAKANAVLRSVFYKFLAMSK